MKRLFANQKRIQEFIDSFTFSRILLFWVVIVMVFGVCYHVFQTPSAFLLETKTGLAVPSFTEAIYFSFITATTTGFGDIVPQGGFRFVAIVEVIMGLLLLAIVTSKLVSLKQNTIIEELYDITLSERINRIRSKLLYISQNCHAFIHKLQDKKVQKRELSTVYQLFQHAKESMDEIIATVKPVKKNTYTTKMDAVPASLIANSILETVQTLEQVIKHLEDYAGWRTQKNIVQVLKTVKTAEIALSELGKNSLIGKDALEEIKDQEKEIFSRIQEKLKASIEA